MASLLTYSLAHRLLDHAVALSQPVCYVFITHVCMEATAMATVYCSSCCSILKIFFFNRNL